MMECMSWVGYECRHCKDAEDKDCETCRIRRENECETCIEEWDNCPRRLEY